MQVSDKLIKPLTEAKYLNADNVRNDKGFFFCRLQTRAVSAGSHNVDRMEESEYDPGYEKGGIH